MKESFAALLTATVLLCLAVLTVSIVSFDESPAGVESGRCTDPRPQACTFEYNPVCGWFKEDIQCVRYPCAADFGNACQACADENVNFWTLGACPQ